MFVNMYSTFVSYFFRVLIKINQQLHLICNQLIIKKILCEY